jgi:hypothetical protein
VAITYDTDFEGSTGSTTLTLNGTIGSGSDQILAIAVGIRSPTGAVTVTWNGVSCTKVAGPATEVGTGCNSYVYRLKAPATGNHDLQVTVATSCDWIAACVVSLFGVDQTTTENDLDTNTVASGAISFPALTTTADGCAVIDAMTSNAAATGTNMVAETNRTQRANLDPAGSGDCFACSSIITKETAGAVTMQWNDIGGAFALAGQAFNPVSEPTTAALGVSRLPGRMSQQVTSGFAS